jgi:hypothetical protein
MKLDLYFFIYIFIAIVAIFLLRLICGLIMMYIIKKYKKLIPKNKKKRKIKIYKNTVPKTDEELMIVHKNNVKKIGIYGQENYNEFDNENLLNQQETKIVGVVKPIGKWTKLILGQRVVGLMQHATLLKQQNNGGYWVNFIHAQRRSRGREHQRF